MDHTSRTQIAVGVIYNETGDKVLLALRPDNVLQGGLWEFPGGKIMQGEDINQALKRELYEELGLKVISSSPLITVNHDYLESSVTLNVHTITDWNGVVSGREGQRIEWVPVNDLIQREFPEANRAIITAVRLPPLYLITPDLEIYNQDFMRDLDDILHTGVKLLQFRSKLLGISERRNVIDRILEHCNANGCNLIVNGGPEEVVDSGCQGVHLSSKQLLQLNTRLLPAYKWVGASCHSLMELDHAYRIGADFAVLGPVKSTVSHPATKPMGWEHFASLTHRSAIPVYAIGGMGRADMKTARGYGGQGVAVIGAVWGARDKAGAVKRILQKKG